MGGSELPQTHRHTTSSITHTLTQCHTAVDTTHSATQQTTPTCCAFPPPCTTHLYLTHLYYPTPPPPCSLSRAKPQLYRHCLCLLYRLAAHPASSSPMLELLSARTQELMLQLRPVLLQPLPPTEATHHLVAVLQQRNWIMRLQVGGRGGGGTHAQGIRIYRYVSAGGAVDVCVCMCVRVHVLVYAHVHVCACVHACVCA